MWVPILAAIVFVGLGAYIQYLHYKLSSLEQKHMKTALSWLQAEVYSNSLLYGIKEACPTFEERISQLTMERYNEEIKRINKEIEAP